MSNIHKRGFASFKDKKRHKEIASLGGKRGHELGTAHEFTREEAKAAAKLSLISRKKNI